jgi:hypothetical protein
VRIIQLAVLTGLIGVVGVSVLGVASPPAAADPADGACAVTGITASSDAEARGLRRRLATNRSRNLVGFASMRNACGRCRTGRSRSW